MFLQLDDYMLPCLNKKLFGVDCLGCGIQRAISLLIHGEFVAAFKMYPAIYTLLILAFFIVINFFYKVKNSQKIISILAIINVLIIVISYFIKMNQLI
ncbi:DUF2752 domain-containing protein [Tenacibaculum retecalamus]|uniref:DUF2752 domain-containing protein n=1 Tax=Tenacibaculum retecalamus TaxID=3018315 RepID=UPI0023D9372D|nr:DUF2752 domain-containing protein [Tenacibaculum retecalamus]WBX72280.1 DUF2752 domain-containing protein [Tenacibaculum retecalamus]